MLHHILTPVEAFDHLARVFNSYLDGLRSLEQVVVPRLSMAAHAALVAEDEASATQYVPEMGAMLYHLATLNTSLHQLAGCLTNAYCELEEFVGEGSDFEAFARYKQAEAARQRGRPSRKHSDWQLKPESLAPFQLHAILSPCFAGHPGAGERIGTSQAINFAYHSNLLRNGLSFGLHDPGQPAMPPNLRTYTPEQGLALRLPAEQPDERWDGYDVSLSGPEAVVEFEALLLQGKEAAALYHSLAPDDAEGYGRLYQLLTKIVDGEEDVIS